MREGGKMREGGREVRKESEGGREGGKEKVIEGGREEKRK